MVYTSIQNEKIKGIKNLNLRKFRDITNSFIVEGEHLVREAYKCNALKEVYVLEGSCVDVSNMNGVSINYVNEKVLKYITELDKFPLIIGVCEKIKLSDNYGDRILVLDNIQDPGNMGTIIRSAVAFGVSNIVLSRDCVDLYNSKVLRSTQGMIFSCNINILDLDDFVSNIKTCGYKVYATRVNGGVSLKAIDRTQKFVVIMGNEGNGVRKSLMDLSDQFLYIDMSSKCESLNVGVATSIILYELSK